MSQISAPRRQPERTRRHLLDEAAALASAGGMAAVTLDAVARKASVSKGGLLHHFPSRQALLDEMFGEMLAEMEAAIAEALDGDPARRGRFTLAYLDVIDRCSDSEESRRQSAFWVLMLGEPALRGRWSAWLSGQLQRHAATDMHPEARAARLAGDGLWLSDLCKGPDSRADARRALVASLRAMVAGRHPPSLMEG